MRDGDRPGNKPGTGMGLAIAKGIVEAMAVTFGSRVQVIQPVPE